MYLKETKREKEESWRKSFGRVLNNFHLRFPDKIHAPGGYYRHLVEENSDMQKTPEELWGSLENQNRKGGRDIKSALFWRQTHQEYYDELIRTAAEVGSSLDEITEKNTEFQRGNSEEVAEALWHLLLPIYVGMRKKGYLPYDLTS